MLCGHRFHHRILAKRAYFPTDLQPADTRPEVWICRGCGLGSTPLRRTFAENRLLEHYTDTPRTPAPLGDLAPDDPRTIAARERVDLIRRNANGAEFLEIGFGDGTTLLEASRAGFRATGIDPTRGYLENEVALKSSGARIFTGALEDSGLPPGSFDVIALFLVLEHVSDPRILIAQLRRLLNPKGALIVEVPDILNYARQPTPSLLTAEHIFHYTRSPLRRIHAEFGFRLRNYISPSPKRSFASTAIFSVDSNNEEAPEPPPVPNQVVRRFRKYLNVLEKRHRKTTADLIGLLQRHRRLAIFGAGSFAAGIVADLPANVRNQIAVFIDETPAKRNCKFFGREILAPEDVDFERLDAVALAAETLSSVIAQKIHRRAPGLECHQLAQSPVD